MRMFVWCVVVCGIISATVVQGDSWSPCGCDPTNGCPNAHYDLSALTKTNDDYAVTDSGKFAFIYDFNICAPVPTTISPTTCATNRGSICQSFGGNYVGTIASWGGGVPPIWSPIDPTNPKVGVQVQFANGDGCNGSPRTSLHTFYCDPNADVLQSYIATTGSGCAYNFNFTTKYACPTSSPPPQPPTPIPGCGCTKGGACTADYDLSGLFLNSSMRQVNDSAAPFGYDFNVCGVVAGSTAPSLCVQSNGTICQTYNGYYVGTLAKWIGSPAIPTWESIDWTHPQLGVRATFSNGDSCNGGPTLTVMNFYCNPQQPDLTVAIRTPVNNCTYQFDFQTRFGCPVSSLSTL